VISAWGPLARGRFASGTETRAGRLVAELARRKDTTPQTVLLWWLRRHPAGIAPVVGTTRPERITACADAARREPDLTHEESYDLWIAARGAPLP
jgi:predicted oxidoreductase